MRYARIRKALTVAGAAVLLGSVALIWQQGDARATFSDPPPEKKDADKPVAKKDLELLQGTWNIDSMEWGGKSLPKELMTGYKFVFAGNKLTWNAALGMTSRMGKITAIDGGYPCDFKIDPGKEPKEIDITLHLKPGDRTSLSLGIYEIKGDTLKVCFFPNSKGRRPTEFASKAGVNIGYIVLTREEVRRLGNHKRDDFRQDSPVFVRSNGTPDRRGIEELDQDVLAHRPWPVNSENPRDAGQGQGRRVILPEGTRCLGNGGPSPRRYTLTVAASHARVCSLSDER